jgi:hypothetical protein
MKTGPLEDIIAAVNDLTMAAMDALLDQSVAAYEEGRGPPFHHHPQQQHDTDRDNEYPIKVVLPSNVARARFERTLMLLLHVGDRPKRPDYVDKALVVAARVAVADTKEIARRAADPRLAAMAREDLVGLAAEFAEARGAEEELRAAHGKTGAAARGTTTRMEDRARARRRTARARPRRRAVPERIRGETTHAFSTHSTTKGSCRIFHILFFLDAHHHRRDANDPTKSNKSKTKTRTKQDLANPSSLLLTSCVALH